MGEGTEGAVIFAELIGTAELYARDGDTPAHEAITRSIENLGNCAAAAKARVIKRIGGRMMLFTDDAAAAARLAVSLQLASGATRARDNLGLGLGVGFHYGPVIDETHDIFGETVNLAARLVEQAARGQILLSAETAERVDSLYKRSIRRLYAMQLKGFLHEVSLCELVWRADGPATFFPFDAVTASDPGHAKLKLKYRGEKLVLRSIMDALTIGRDRRCNLVVDDELASRNHCVIQRRHDHFVLADKSTNGTFVTVEGEDEVMLQRDELTLRKRGWISFGKPRVAAVEVVEFICG
jgi:adenylate cyclase